MRFSTIPGATALSLLAFAGNAQAFWRMECRSESGMARIDPLVNPGDAGAHMHSIFGSNGKSAISRSTRSTFSRVLPTIFALRTQRRHGYT
jgi:hypothetical protein